MLEMIDRADTAERRTLLEGIFGSGLAAGQLAYGAGVKLGVDLGSNPSASLKQMAEACSDRALGSRQERYLRFRTWLATNPQMLDESFIVSVVVYARAQCVEAMIDAGRR